MSMARLESRARILRPFKCHDDGPDSTSRNLVVCIDGTSNQFCTKNTNIVELYSQITKNNQQLTYYSTGLGAIAKVNVSSVRQRLSNDLDMAIGRNLHKVIMASYRWLCDNYQDGDRVFLFGFSRGAYQVRALAGMISLVGLLLPGNNEQIPFAFELYSKTSDEDLSLARPASVISQPVTKESEKKAKYSELAKTFQRTFCRGDVHIHFVGVWDTVSSVGLGRGKTLPRTTTSSEHICYFRHALALDERRVKFLPEYVYGGRSACSDDGRIKEVWFAGSHADVGGGNRRNDKLQSGDIPLLWMRSQAVDAGLTMEPADVLWKIDDLNQRITPSLGAVWWFLELLPLKRLLYYNSDRYTYKPHVGGPRRILPGQKVHVSVLFKNNYKPFARFYNYAEPWPESMFWNDESSHERLKNLSGPWERDIFDETSLQTLFESLRGHPNIDALDRLGFMASFEVCKVAIVNNENAKQILGPFLNDKDKLIRLSTAVTYCELEWSQDLETTQGDLGQQIASDISELLDDEKDRRRACIYLPSLCKWTKLKPKLINDHNLKKLVEFCDNVRVGKREEGTSTIAFHGAQALFMLMKLDDTLAQKLIDIQTVSDITEALRSNCKPVLVAVLNVLDVLVVHKSGRDYLMSGTTPATLVKLLKHFDDFVAPAAIRVICSLLQEDDLPLIMLRFGVLSIFLDMLDRCSSETKQVTCWALVQFAKYESVQRVMIQEGYLQALAKRVQNHAPNRRDGAISALVMLSDAHVMTAVKTAVKDAIETTKTIDVLIARLNMKMTALSAASVLARLMKIEDIAILVSNNKSGAVMGIVSMLQHRWFDGLRGEDGLQVLAELLECDRLQSAVIQAGAIGALREMINPAHYESTYAGLHYLRVIARFDEGPNVIPSSEMLILVPHVVSALRMSHRRVQRIAMEILLSIAAEAVAYSNESAEDLRTPIVDGLLDLLKERQAHVVLAASTLLGLLSSDKSVREKVVGADAVWNLSQDYYRGLKLGHDEKGRGPRIGDVYNAVGRMIKLVQEPESAYETGAGPEHAKEGGAVELGRDRDWQLVAEGPVLYEPKKEDQSTLHRISALLCCLPFLLCEAGQWMDRDLWQEG